MGGSKTTTTSSNTIDPELMRLYRENYDTANRIAERPYQPYMGERIAGFTPLQFEGMDALTSIARNNVGADALDAAGRGYADLAAWRPSALASPGSLSARTFDPGQVSSQAITADQLKNTDLSPYMNPYMQSVIDTSLADLERQRDVQRVKDDQAATASKAFGGSRHGVADALTSEAYLRNVAGTTAGLRSSAYDRAVESAVSDINRRLGADQFNATQSLDAAKFNAMSRMEADQFNANSWMNADKYNLDMALGLSKLNSDNDYRAAELRGRGADALANLSGQQIMQAMQRAGLLGQVGDMQHKQQQRNLDSAYERFMEEWSYPLLQQQLRNAALGMMPVQSTQTNTTSSSPGALDIFGAVLGTASKAAPIFFSDIRAKENIRTAGYDAQGRRWVDFNYRWEDPAIVRRGVIAQEILKSDPDAVSLDEETGLYRVDYSKLEGDDE